MNANKLWRDETNKKTNNNNDNYDKCDDDDDDDNDDNDDDDYDGDDDDGIKRTHARTLKVQMRQALHFKLFRRSDSVQSNRDAFHF